MLQSSIKWWAQLITCAHVSDTSFHNLRFLCFQRLQRKSTKCWERFCEKCCRSAKIVTTTEFESIQSGRYWIRVIKLLLNRWYNWKKIINICIDKWNESFILGFFLFFLQMDHSLWNGVNYFFERKYILTD